MPPLSGRTKKAGQKKQDFQGLELIRVIFGILKPVT